MIRCPIICIVDVCRYSNVNDPASVSRNSTATPVSDDRSPAGMYSSMTSFVR